MPHVGARGRRDKHRADRRPRTERCHGKTGSRRRHRRRARRRRRGHAGRRDRDVLGRPERVGQTWDLEATPLVEPSELGGLLARITTNLAGDGDVDVIALQPRGDGRRRKGRCSALLAQESDRLAALHRPARSGSGRKRRGCARAAGTASGDRCPHRRHHHRRPDRIRARVVGIALVAQTPHSSFDEGAWSTPETLDAATGTTSEAREFSDSFLVRVSDGASVEAVEAVLVAMGLYVERPTVPPEFPTSATCATCRCSSPRSSSYWPSGR